VLKDSKGNREPEIELIEDMVKEDKLSFVFLINQAD